MSNGIDVAMETSSSKTVSYRIYYEDTDAGGIVYYANYLKFAERGRTEYLRSLGFDHISLAQDENLFFVVRHIEADYHKPARLDDVITISTSVKIVRKASFVMTQHIYRDEELLVTLSVRLASISGKGRPVRLPADIADSLQGVK